MSLFLQSIKGDSFMMSEFAKFLWRYTGHLLELRREICRRTVSKPVSYLACGKLAVTEQLLHILDAMDDGEALDGDALHFGEQLAQRTIVFGKLTRKIVGQPWTFSFRTHPLKYGDAYLLHQLRTRVVEQFEAYFLQLFSQALAFFGRQTLLCLHFAQTDRLHRKTF